MGTTEPGEYFAAGGFADFTFTLGSGWGHGGVIEDAGFFVALEDQGGLLTGTHFDGEVFVEPCDAATGTSTIDAAPESLLMHIDSLDGFEMSEPIEIDVGGYDGLSVDLTTDLDCPPPGIAFLWTLPVVSEFHLLDDQRVRIVAIDADGETIVFIAEADTTDGDYEALVAATDEILDTLTIDP